MQAQEGALQEALSAAVTNFLLSPDSRLCVSAIWCGLSAGLCIAASGRVSSLPSRGQALVISIALGWTAVFISVNLYAVASAWLSRVRRVAALLDMVMVQALFGVMFAEVYYLLGPAHFQCSGTPRPHDWLAFTFAQLMQKVDILDALVQLHLVRERFPHHDALDLLDAIVQFHLDRQTLHPRGALVGILLVLINLINGLVILEVLGRILRQLRKALFGDVHNQMATYLIRIMVVTAVVVAGLFVLFWLPLHLFILFGGGPPPSPAEREQAYTAFVVSAGLILGIVVLLLIERRYFHWRINKYGNLPAMLAADGQTIEWKGSRWEDIVQLGAVLLFFPLLLIAALAVTTSVWGLINGIQAHGRGAMATWAWTNILQVMDIGNVMEVFDLRPSAPNEPSLAVPALVVRGATSLVLSLLIAGAARWWTRRLDKEQEDRISPSLEGWRGLSAGTVLAAILIAVFTSCC